MAQLGRALRSGRRSRRFKSCHADRINKRFPISESAYFYVKKETKMYFCFLLVRE